MPEGCAATTAGGGDIVRYKTPGSTFHIAAALEIPTDPAAYGDDTEGQTVAIFKSIDEQLKSMNLTMSDVVKVQVFLVAASAKGGKMDFAGFMRGYTQYFGTAAQPHLPARSAFQIAALANRAWYVEIEVVAVRVAKTAQ